MHNFVREPLSFRLEVSREMTILDQPAESREMNILDHPAESRDMTILIGNCRDMTIRMKFVNPCTASFNKLLLFRDLRCFLQRLMSDNSGQSLRSLRLFHWYFDEVRAHDIDYQSLPVRPIWDELAQHICLSCTSFTGSPSSILQLLFQER